MEIFVFTENLFFVSVLYKVTAKIPFLFELVMSLYQVQMKVEPILQILHISGTRMIEAGIYGLYRVNNMGK